MKTIGLLIMLLGITTVAWAGAAVDAVEVRVAEGGVDAAAGRLRLTMRAWVGAEAEENREAVATARRIREREEAAAAAAAAAAGEEVSREAAAAAATKSPFQAAWEKAVRDAESKARKPGGP